MLEEDEVNNTAAKSLVKSVFNYVGKQPKYPIAISEILKGIDQFPGRLRVRESTDSRGKSVDVDVETETANPATKVFSLESGAYNLTLERTTEKASFERTTEGVMSSSETNESRVLQVDVKNEDGKITVSSSGGGKLVVGELRNNEFSGSMNESSGPVRLKGKLTANNEVSGDVTGEAKDGQKAVKGTFKLVKTPVAIK
jgi:hypothetical protein